MNFRQLEYIIAVDTYRNFKRASIACEVAQSTLSKEIQRLEKEYDIVIFDRSRHPVVPTLKGIDLIRKAKEIRFQQKEFVQIALTKENEVSGQLNLTIAETLAPYITPFFIKTVAKKYPKLEIKILELSDRRIEDLLIREEVDAAVMIAPSLTHGYYEQKLFSDELCIYSTKKLSKENHRHVLLSDIDFKDVILHKDLRDILLKQVKNLESKSSESLKKNNIKYLKGSLETVRNIINMNGGTMFLPKIALNYIPKNHLNRVYTLKGEQLTLKVSLIYSRGFQKKRIIKRLVSDITETMTIN